MSSPFACRNDFWNGNEVLKSHAESLLPILVCTQLLKEWAMTCTGIRVFLEGDTKQLVCLALMTKAGLFGPGPQTMWGCLLETRLSRPLQT